MKNYNFSFRCRFLTCFITYLIDRIKLKWYMLVLVVRHLYAYRIEFDTFFYFDIFFTLKICYFVKLL
jgi:hypothetical protein